LPKAPAPKSKTAAPIAQNHLLSPQIISPKSPAISATRYTAALASAATFASSITSLASSSAMSLPADFSLKGIVEMGFGIA